MPPVNLTPLITEIRNGFAALTAAVTASQTVVDLTPLTVQITRVADALYADPDENEQSIASLVEESNSQVGSVIGTYSDGDRVKVFNETPL